MRRHLASLALSTLGFLWTCQTFWTPSDAVEFTNRLRADIRMSAMFVNGVTLNGQTTVTVIYPCNPRRDVCPAQRVDR